MTTIIGIQENEFDLVIYQGKTIKFVFTVNDVNNNIIDLTNYTVRMKAKTRYNTNTTIFNFSDSEGHFTFDAINGKIILLINPADTENIRFNRDDEELELVYDIELVSQSGVVTVPARGKILLKREVTTI